MADDQEVQGGEATTSEPSQAPEQTTSSEVEGSEAQVSDQQESQETQTSQEDDGGLVKSKRGQDRIQQLANERNELAQENKKLRDFVPQQEQQPEAEQQVPPWMQRDPLQDLGSEVTPDQYRQHVVSQADRIAQLRIAQYQKAQERRKKLDNDLSYLEKTYPELSKEIDDPKLSNSLEKAKRNYQIALQANPDASLRDFIEPIMEARVGGMDRGRETASQNLAKQSQESAVKSGTQTQESASVEDLRKEMWKDPGKVARILEEKLPKD